MQKGASFSLCWYLGRHETLAAGFWIYQRALLEGLVGLAKEDPAQLSQVTDLTLLVAGPEELFSLLSELTSSLPFPVEIRTLPLAKYRFVGNLLDTVFLAGTKDLTHAMVNTLPIVCVGKKIVTLHDLIQAYPPFPVSGIKSFLKRLYYRVMLSWVTSRANLIVVGHEQTALLLEHKNYKPEELKVLYPPLDGAFLNQAVSMGKLVADKLRIIAFASKDPRKNIEFFLEAFKSRQVELNLTLTLVCSTKSVELHFKEIIESLELTASVELVTSVERSELPALYQQHDLVAFPSIAEGFGYPIYEALCLGLRVIADRSMPVKRFPESARPLLVLEDCSSASALSAALLRARNLEPTEQEILTAAQAIRELLSPTRQAKSLIDSYGELFFQDCK